MDVLIREKACEETITIKDAREVASRLWCQPQHQHKTMDPDLAESIARALIQAIKFGWIRGADDGQRRAMQAKDAELVFAQQVMEAYHGQSGVNDARVRPDHHEPRHAENVRHWFFNAAEPAKATGKVACEYEEVPVTPESTEMPCLRAEELTPVATFTCARCQLPTSGEPLAIGDKGPLCGPCTEALTVTDQSPG